MIDGHRVPPEIITWGKKHHLAGKIQPNNQEISNILLKSLGIGRRLALNSSKKTQFIKVKEGLLESFRLRKTKWTWQQTTPTNYKIQL